MERIITKKVSAFLATILADMLFSSIAFQKVLNAYTEKDTDFLYSTRSSERTEWRY